MNVTHTLLASLVALSLTACGGGGSGSGSGGGANAPTTTDAPLSLAEFEGKWKLPTEDCDNNFPYNPAYWSKLRDVTATIDKGTLRIAVAVQVFDDAACAVKRGLVTENVVVTPEKTALDGRDNVFKGSGTYTGVQITADGGIGTSLNKVPDGTLSDFAGKKFLADVKDGRWYITLAEGGRPVDGTGYPIQIDTSDYLVR